MLAKGADVLMTSSVIDELEPQAWHKSNGFQEQGAIAFGSFQSKSEVFFYEKPIAIIDGDQVSQSISAALSFGTGRRFCLI